MNANETAKAKNQKPSILRKDFVFSETDFFQSEKNFYYYSKTSCQMATNAINMFVQI